MTFKEVQQMSRAEICFQNVCTFKCLHPRLYLQKCESEQVESHVIIRIVYYDLKLDRHVTHNYHFFTDSEKEDAKSFVNLIRGNFPGTVIDCKF